MICFLLCRKSAFEPPRRGKQIWTPPPVPQKEEKKEIDVVDNFTIFLNIEDYFNGVSFWVNLEKRKINKKYTRENAEIDCRKVYDEMVAEERSNLGLEELMVFQDPEFKCNYTNPISKWGFIEVQPGEDVGKMFYFNNQTCAVIIDEKPSNKYRRNGDSLHMDLGITQEESMLGYNKSIVLPDGRSVYVSGPGFRRRPVIVKHEGFTNKETGIKGNLAVHLHIDEDPEYL